MAVYSPEQRREFLAMYDAGVSQYRICKTRGIKPGTFKRWRMDREKYTAPDSNELMRAIVEKHLTKKPVSNEPLSTAVHTESPVGIRIAVIGDMQVKPGIDFGYCNRVGRYIADKKPDVIVNIGDFADMPSMSFHDQPGSKAYAAQNYKDDILSVHHGMKALMEPIQQAMLSGWKPRLVMCLGNHEDRIDRTISAIPKLDGTIGLPDLEYERWGWEVHPFMKQVTIAGVTFAHYFASGQMGRPISSARAMLTKLHTSAICGHQQGRDVAFSKRADGRQLTAIICGSTYEHDEGYLNHQTNNHWRGFYMLNDVVDGEFEEMAVSMKYLRRRYA